MLGVLVQNKIAFGHPGPIPGLTINIYAVVVESIYTAYALVSIVICFYAYREFKGMLYDTAGMNAQMPMMGQRVGGRSDSVDTDSNVPRGNLV